MRKISQYAFRQIFSPHKKFLANGRIVGAFLGIILSLVPVMVVMVVVDGMIDGISDRFISLGDSHIKVSSYTKKSEEEVQKIIKSVENLNRVESAIPSYSGRGMVFNPKTKLKTGIEIKAFPPNLIDHDDGYKKYLQIEDGIFSLKNKNDLMLSSVAAKQLKIKVGDSVFVLIVAEIYGKEMTIRKSFKVAGIFSTGYYQLDNISAYINYELGGKFFSENGSKIYLKIENPNYQLTNITNQVRIAANDIGSWHVSTWEMNNRTFFQNLQNTRFLIMLVMVGIIFVTSFNILSTFFMIVKEKESDIAILKSCGVQRKEIIKSFLLSGLILAVLGTFLGIFLGILVAININGLVKFIEDLVNYIRNFKTIIFSESNNHFSILSSDYYLEEIPIRISWLKTIVIAFCSITLAFVFTFIPAFIGGSIKPIEIIRKH